jgi:hypothetical protein
MSNSPRDDLQAWLDRSELAELVATLSSAVDRGDRERIVACYTEDSHDDHGSFKGTGQAFAEFVCGPQYLDKMFHLLGQSVFDVQGDEAWGETFFLLHGGAGTITVSGHGRYVDYFQRINGTWKLKYRRVVPEEVPAGDDPANYWPGTRDRQDPLYDRRRGPDD